MTAEIIPFPGLIERVARRMLPVMETPPGEQRDDVLGQAATELCLTRLAARLLRAWRHIRPARNR